MRHKLLLSCGALLLLTLTASAFQPATACGLQPEATKTTAADVGRKSKAINEQEPAWIGPDDASLPVLQRYLESGDTLTIEALTAIRQKRNWLPYDLIVPADAGSGKKGAATTPASGDAAPAKKSTQELNEARQTGWQLVLVIVDKLEQGDQKKFPGIRAWLKDFRKVSKGIHPKVAADQWPALDVDALVSRNPHFWQAYYEIAPADPGLIGLHAGLLLSAGETTRASQLLVVGLQRTGVPQEFRQAFGRLLTHCQRAEKRSNEVVAAGIKLFDKGDYASALKKHREALDLLPQNGFAHYELGLTLRHQEWIAAGVKPPPLDSVEVNSGKKHSPPVAAAFAKARRHDPFQLLAYQGEDKKVIQGFLALARKGMPAWKKLARNPEKAVPDAVLEDLAGACQQASIHELALAVRQVLVARRGRYAPADHPFITTSLRQLAPGQTTEDVLKRLNDKGQLNLRLLVAPEPEAP